MENNSILNYDKVYCKFHEKNVEYCPNDKECIRYNYDCNCLNLDVNYCNNLIIQSYILNIMDYRIKIIILNYVLNTLI